MGLLTPLTFARHCLSPLAAFTSGAYFLHSGRRWQWICEFYTANVKGIFWGTVIMCLEISNNMLLMLWDAPKRIFSTNSRSSDQPQNNAETLFAHPPSPFHGNFCNCNSIGICTASQFKFHLPLLYTVWSNAYSEIGPEVRCNLSRLLSRKITKRIHSSKPASLNRPIKKDFLSKKVRKQKICNTSEYSLWNHYKIYMTEVKQVRVML